MIDRRRRSRAFGVLASILYGLGLSSHHGAVATDQETAGYGLNHEDLMADGIDESNVSGDTVRDSFLDSLAMDPSCNTEGDEDCFSPPESTIQTETKWDATCFKGGGDDYIESEEETENSQCTPEEILVDKHWGSDPILLKMRNQLRTQAQNSLEDKRPPIFLMPGLAATRLVAWKLKKCSGMFAGDIKVQDNVWLNINLVIQMGAINVECMKECLSLGLNQSDTDDWDVGCKLRPDEGLDSIASLAPGGIGSSLLVGGTNTVYAWLIQWLADNLGYDVTNVIGLPYDWRLSPDKMEDRDGFLSMTRRRIEAAVSSNGQPGIMVAHSMGNLVFRYFLEWLRVQMREEAYENYVTRARRRAKNMQKKQQNFGMNNNQASHKSSRQSSKKDEESQSSFLPGWVTGVVSGIDEWYDWLTDENAESGTESRDENEILNDKLWELASEEGDAMWLEWVEKHIWTYVGLSAPMLGATNPLRSVISGENMGLPIQDEVARIMEITFGSTHTLNPVSIATGFCDEWEANDWGAGEVTVKKKAHKSNLACLDDITNDIENSSPGKDPWKDFPALKALLRDRIDWNSSKPMIDIEMEACKRKGKGKEICVETDHLKLGPKDVESGRIFDIFDSLWKENGKPLIIKREQLEESFINTNVANMLNHTWERPLIKHVIMSYGADVPTEVGYIYKKRNYVDEESSDESKGSAAPSNATDGVPHLKTVLWEETGGKIFAEEIEAPRGSIAEHFIKKKKKKEPFEYEGSPFEHSGDGSVPYLSLSWVHTWLLHAARARRPSDGDDINEPIKEGKSALNYISVSHRPSGATDWVDGPPPPEIEVLDPSKLIDTADTGVDHPHGTRYKPLMKRYHNVGVSRTTGIEYTTTVIEAIGVEHKETTRNYDILAAVFTDVLKYMHDDLGLV